MQSASLCISMCMSYFIHTVIVGTIIISIPIENLQQILHGNIDDQKWVGLEKKNVSIIFGTISPF